MASHDRVLATVVVALLLCAVVTGLGAFGAAVLCDLGTSVCLSAVSVIAGLAGGLGRLLGG